MVDFRRKNIRLPEACYLGRQWYFLTLCTQDRLPRFTEPQLVEELFTALKTAAGSEGFQLPAYCFMPDHLHVLANGTEGNSNLLAFADRFKQKSGYRFRQQKKVRLWQPKYYDHILRPTDRWEAVAWYIWMNPVRKGLCARPEDWPHSGSCTMDWKKLLAAPDVPWIPPWKCRT